MKTATCQQCSNLFIITPGSYGKFCSLSCGTTFRNKINLEKINDWNKKYTEQATGFEPATNSLEG